MHQKSISAGATSQNLLGELTVLPNPHDRFKGLLLRRGKGRGKERRGRKGTDPRLALV